MEDFEKKKKKTKFLEKPLYPGGAKALREFVNAHLQYPQDAMDQHVEGVVTVAYQVNDDGEVENPTVVKSLCPSCDEEALRIVRMLRYDKVRNRGIRLKTRRGRGGTVEGLQVFFLHESEITARLVSDSFLVALRGAMMDLKTAGIERGSIDFWKQVQLGNVFAYPAGDTLPVQMSFSAS